MATNIYKSVEQELGLNFSRSQKPDAHLHLHNSKPFNDIVSFVRVPINLEKFMTFGIIYCVNNFLKTFTILPVKVCISLYKIAKDVRNQFIYKQCDFRNDFHYVYMPLTECLLLCISFGVLNKLDTSKVYHDIRRQSAIKLYVMIGVLEVLDKLVCSIGQDLIQYLMNLQFKFKANVKMATIQYCATFCVTLGYLLVHASVLIYQTVSLNVAVNSYSNALFTLILSSQFSEIKSTVFKKFDRENLFQNACADLTERFQILISLLIIGLRNLNEIEFHDGLVPKSLNRDWFTTSLLANNLKIFLNPAIIVLGSEFLVDWFKHSFIAKFNKFNPKIYSKFLSIFTNDYLELNYAPHNISIEELNYKAINSKQNLHMRIGVPMLALNLVIMKMSWPSLGALLGGSQFYTIVINVAIFVILFILKLILSLILAKWAKRQRRKNAQKLKKFETAVTEIEPNKEYHSKLYEMNDILKDQYAKGDLTLVGLGSLSKEDLKVLYDGRRKDSIDELRKRKDISSKGLEEVVRYDMCSKKIY